MRFVQFADVHLDSYIGGATKLPGEKREALRRDIRTAFSRACRLAMERNADLVLIPGDLFDYETADTGTTAFLTETLRGIYPIPVFISPGNHDSLRPRGPYAAVGGSAWPENVRLFTSPEFKTIVMEELGCSVTGIAHAHRGVTDRLPAQRLARPDCPINILLFHGSRDGYRPSDKENVIPFSDEELRGQGFTYAAIGHYHSFGRIDGANGQVVGAYSGCIQGRGLDETGEKQILVGEIDGEGRVTLEGVEVAPRRIVSIEASVSGATSNADVADRIDATLAGSQARECDVVYVALTGVLPPTIEIDTSAWEPSTPYFHVTVNNSRVEPDYDLESLAEDSAAASLRSAFVRRMLELEREAADDRQRQVVRDAVYYGLYALDNRKLEPRDVD